MEGRRRRWKRGKEEKIMQLLPRLRIEPLESKTIFFLKSQKIIKQKNNIITTGKSLGFPAPFSICFFGWEEGKGEGGNDERWSRQRKGGEEKKIYGFFLLSWREQNLSFFYSLQVNNIHSGKVIRKELGRIFFLFRALFHIF